MNTQTELLKKLEALLPLISEVIRDIPQSILSEAGKELKEKLTQVTSAGLTDEVPIRMWLDVFWLASQMYKDRTRDGLSETEQQLVAVLEEGGYLTRDPDLISPTAG